MPDAPAAQAVLLLGEGDFSFARALGRRRASVVGKSCGTSPLSEISSVDIPSSLDTWRIVASEVGTFDQVCVRYFDGQPASLEARCQCLSDLGVEVLFGLDATHLGDHHLACQRWCPKTRQLISNQCFWGLLPVQQVALAQVVFNFPHTDRHGKISHLLRGFFRGLRSAIRQDLMPNECQVEMRLRHVSFEADGIHRSAYGHQAAASDAGFSIASVERCDLDPWREAGYAHRSTKRNASCGHLENNTKTWKWQAQLFDQAPGEVARPLPGGCPTSFFYAIEGVLDTRVVPGPPGGRRAFLNQVLVHWKGFSKDQSTWEFTRDVDKCYRGTSTRSLAGAQATQASADGTDIGSRVG